MTEYISFATNTTWCVESRHFKRR